MSIKVERIPNKPIILLTSKGAMTVDDVLKAYEETAQLAGEMNGLIYRVVDVREQTTTFPEMMEIMKVVNQNTMGSPSDERIQTIYVGREKFAMMAREMFSRKTGRAFPIFETVEAAFDAISKGGI